MKYFALVLLLLILVSCSQNDDKEIADKEAVEVESSKSQADNDSLVKSPYYTRVIDFLKGQWINTKMVDKLHATRSPIESDDVELQICFSCCGSPKSKETNG